MTDSWPSRLGLLTASGIAMLPIAFGVIQVVQGPSNIEDEPAAAWIIWAILRISIGIVIIVGLLKMRAKYSLGMTLVATGVVTLCLFTFWMAWVTVPLGIALLVVAHLRGRRTPLAKRSGSE